MPRPELFKKKWKLYTSYYQCHQKSDHIYGQINQLKMQIDKLRKQRINYLKIFQVQLIIRTFKNKSNIMKNKHQQKLIQLIQNKILSVKKTQLVDTKSKILQLRESNQEQKQKFQTELIMLKKQIQQQQIQNNYRTHSLISTKDNIQDFDTAIILKKRLQKIIFNNKQKVKIICIYQRNMNIIDQAFNSIKQSTGLTDIQQIQNTFIKSQQQNCGLLTYLDILNQQIDTLVEENNDLQKKCDQLELVYQQKLKILQGTPDQEKRRRKITGFVKEKEKDILQMQQLFQKLNPIFTQALKTYANSPFNNDQNKIFQYQNQIRLNEHNIDHYLAEYQKFVSDIVHFKAHKSNMLPPQILLLEDIPSKQKNISKTLTNAPIYNEQGVQQNVLYDEKKLKQIALETIQKRKLEGQKKKRK